MKSGIVGQILTAALVAAISAIVWTAVDPNGWSRVPLLTFHPERYHGYLVEEKFFEGWYFKVADKHQDHVLAIVIGVFKGVEGGEEAKVAPERQSQSFIFVSVNGKESHHFRFPVSAFEAAKDKFEVRIGKNVFTSTSVTLDLDYRTPSNNKHDARLVISGHISFNNLKPWPVSPLFLGAMGPTGWLPLECYHGVLSFDHDVSGSLLINGTSTSFHGGKGYTEKDWGRNFPASWIWFQSNHFENAQGTSLLVSLAKVPLPLVPLDLPGILVAFHHKGELYRFTSYLLPRVLRLEHRKNDRIVLHLQTLTHRLEVEIYCRDLHFTTLYGPINDSMIPFVPESLGAKAKVTLYQRNLLGAGGNDTLIYSGTGHNGGLEIIGDTDWLLEHVGKFSSIFYPW